MPFRRARQIPFGELEGSEPLERDATLAVSDIAAIMYTSGTTGRSKGVLLPYGHLHLNPHVYIEQLGLTADDVIYICLPLFHANGLLLGIYAALILGCRAVLAPGFSASRWASDVRTSGATVTNLLGVMTDFVLAQPPHPDDRTSALRAVIAVPFSPEQAEAFRDRFGAEIGSLYGSTELNCPIYRPPGTRAQGGSCGRVVSAWFEARLADPETDLEVPEGEPGELLVRPLVPWTTMAGYHGQPEATLAAWRNLWFHTGDLMRRDGHGNYVYLDRLKDCIRRRGENVSAAEVEAVLARHPAVAQVAVVGIPSPFDAHEQEVKACIVAAAEGRQDPEEISAYCRERMPGFAVPRFIEFYATLPTTPTGKVAKAELRTHGVRKETWVSPDANGRRGRAA
jgi:crotonobetaine/carnitine-CoA ligase